MLVGNYMGQRKTRKLTRHDIKFGKYKRIGNGV